MTAVPGTAVTAVLLCDYCGHESPPGRATAGAELVWPLVSELGWTGSAFATGPHRCPRCSDDDPTPPAPPARNARAHGASYELRTDQDLDAVLVTPLADLDADLADRLRDDLMDAAAGRRHVVIDMHAAGFIDSAGLGLLVRARQEARQRETSFDLAGPSRFVLTVLHTMRLDGVFRTFPDAAEALRTIRAQERRPGPAGR